MRPKKSRKSFTLYLKKIQAGPVWYALFWDENARRYVVTRSTGVFAEGRKQRRYEAEQAASTMLPGIRFAAKAPDRADKSFPRYMSPTSGFPDSPYVKECALVKKNPLSAAYVNMTHENVRRYMAPFPGFKGITLRNLTPGIIQDWMTWAASNKVSGRIINLVLQGMRIAVRYAVDREEISLDPFRTIKKASEDYRGKGILAPPRFSGLSPDRYRIREGTSPFFWAFSAGCAVEKSGAYNGGHW